MPGISNSLMGKPIGKPDGLVSLVKGRERMIDIAWCKPKTPATQYTIIISQNLAKKRDADNSGSQARTISNRALNTRTLKMKQD